MGCIIMESKTKQKEVARKIVKAIYNGVQKSGISSHIYSDTDWAKVYELRDIAKDAARSVDSFADIVFVDVETTDTCKRYSVEIEDGYDGTLYGGGCIVASFAGSVERPYERYDVCATWWGI